MPPDEQLVKPEAAQPRAEIADVLAAAADQIDADTVQLEDTTTTHQVAIPDTPLLEVELERLTDSETGDQRYELEYEIRWTD